MLKNDEFIEIAPVKVNINDIFNKKIDLCPLIQFNLLQKVIEEFINRQNKTNDKIKELEEKVIKIYKLKNNDFKNAINDLNQNNKIKENDLEINDIIEKKENNDILRDIHSDKGLDNKDISLNDEKINTENNILNNSNLNIFNEDNNIELNKKDRLAQLYSKINKLEIKFNNLLENFSFLNKNSKKEFQLIKEKNISFDEKFLNQDKIIKELSEKMTDIIFKEIEQNLLKKFEFLDVRSNSNEESILKLKNEIVEIKNTNENLKQLSENIKDNYNNFLNETKSKLNIFQKKYDEISELKKIINNFISKEDLLIYINELNQKNNEISKKLSENKSGLEKYQVMVEKFNKKNEEMKSYINKILEEYITDLNIDLIKKEISQVKQELNKKLNKENLGSINLRIETIENIQDNYKSQMDEFKNDIFNCNDKYSKAIRMIESLRSQILNLKKEERKENNKNEHKEKEKEKNIEIDLSSYVSKDIFDEEINIILKKMEKISIFETDNYRSIQVLEEHIKNSVSENDLRNIEQYLINVIDEYNIKNSKKFVDKSEYLKTIKYFEVQIKHLNDITSKDNENCLIAKKPINNYICASCEAYIGNLKNKEEFSSWNKMPPRENHKRYRLGHGFSKILKLINKDLLQKNQRVNSGINIGIQVDRKKLPKINLQNQIINEDDLNEKINNSADNIEKNNLTNEPIFSDKGEITERTLNKSTITNNLNISTKNIENDDDRKPKLIKIYKKIKK